MRHAARPLCHVLTPQAHATDIRQRPEYHVPMPQAYAAGFWQRLHPCAKPLTPRPHATGSCHRFLAEAAFLLDVPCAASSRYKPMPQIPGRGCISVPGASCRVLGPQAHASGSQRRPQPCDAYFVPRPHVTGSQYRIPDGNRSPTPQPSIRVLMPQVHATDFWHKTEICGMNL
eukprot:gene8152-biopygen2426